MMLRLLISGMVLLGSVGCVTGMGGGAANERMEMTGLEDMSLDYIKTKWGEPETSVMKGEGRVVHFKKIRSQDEDPISQKISVKYCDLRLELNKAMLVKSWVYEDCKPVLKGK